MDKPDAMGDLPMTDMANATDSPDTMDIILNSIMGLDARKKLRERAIARRNIPCVEEHIAPPNREEIIKLSAERLLIVDRILEPQSMAHFMASLSGKALPGGAPSESDLSRKEVILTGKPYSSWAPPPFNTIERSANDNIMEFIGSMEDYSRLQVISKELQAMKARLWEGLMPVSARRWRERGLDHLSNFSVACRIISMAINVFLYLNSPVIQAALRETYNRIYDELSTFERAFCAYRAAQGKPESQVCRVWYNFMRAHYSVMVNRTYTWVMDHVATMKANVLAELAAHQPTTTDGSHDEIQWRLTDMWQDLSSISTCADYAILLPMDGYKGSDIIRPSEPGEYDFRTQPLSMKPDLAQREREYHLRRRHLIMTTKMDELTEIFDNATIDTPLDEGGHGRPAPMNDPSEITKICRLQEAERQRVAAELREEPVQYEKEPWASILWETSPWGFVAYRTHPSCSDDEWAEFRSKFEADIADWGQELPGISSLRERSRIHWIDANDLGIDGQDIEALKSAFNDFTETPEFPSNFFDGIFLVADEASISSYSVLSPAYPASGGVGGFILAVDSDFDPEEGLRRPEESPGYQGTLRLLGSLIWDDLGSLIATQSQLLEHLWPLAMNQEDEVYIGYVSDIKSPA